MKTIIIYHSYMGNTRGIAKQIKEQHADFDICELEPQIPFSKNYDTVVNEYQNNEKDKKTVKIQDPNIDLSKYDTIILGTPVWWYTMSPVVREFLVINDLSNKTIVPFATNGGWIGRTIKDIQNICPKSKIINPIDIRFNESKLVTSKSEIENWIKLI